MIKIDNDSLYKEYYDIIKVKYPQYTFEQVKEIITCPWKYLKEEMSGDDLTEIRFKYFGKFQVYLGRAKIMLNHIVNHKESYKEQDYTRLTNSLNKFINKNETQNNN